MIEIEQIWTLFSEMETIGPSRALSPDPGMLPPALSLHVLTPTCRPPPPPPPLCQSWSVSKGQPKCSIC